MFGLSLSDDIAALSTHDSDGRIGPHPDEFDGG